MRAVFSCFNSAQRPLIGLFSEPQFILTSYPFGFLERSQVFFFSFKLLSRKIIALSATPSTTPANNILLIWLLIGATLLSTSLKTVLFALKLSKRKA
jgi:hypothetical protein